MKIIRQGLIPEEVVYRTECSKCDTEFEFTQKEGKYNSDQRDGDYISINCPTCGTQCTAQYMSPKEYTRRKESGRGYMDR